MVGTWLTASWAELSETGAGLAGIIHAGGRGCLVIGAWLTCMGVVYRIWARLAAGGRGKKLLFSVLISVWRGWCELGLKLAFLCWGLGFFLSVSFFFFFDYRLLEASLFSRFPVSLPSPVFQISSSVVFCLWGYWRESASLPVAEPLLLELKGVSVPLRFGGASFCCRSRSSE